MSLEINFFKEEVKFKLSKKEKLVELFSYIISKEKRINGTINFIFCKDKYLLKINKQYLKHDTLTDIITFEFYDENRKLTSDIYISIERVKENAEVFKTEFKDELNRVMIHGILHLVGHKDKTKEDKIKMFEMENKYLKQLKK